MLHNLGQPQVFFDVDDQGGGGETDPSQDKNKPAGGGSGAGAGDAQPAKKEFSQEQLDKLFGDTRKQGRDSLAKEILDKTGLTSIDDVLAAIAAHKKSEDEKLSEVEKQKKIADDAKVKNDKLENELRQTRFERDFDRTVLKLQLEFQNEKARDVAFKLLDIDTAGKDANAMEEAVKVLLQEHAYLFVEAEAEEIDATRRGKTNSKILKKEIIEAKRRNGAYATI